jgi:chemotaxis protein histidine kinase CheA
VANKADFNKNLEAIKQRFLKQLQNWLPEYEIFLDNIKKNNIKTKELEDIRMRSHKLAGTSKIFGFAALGKTAFRAEKQLDGWIKKSPTKKSPYLTHYCKMLKMLL